MNLARMQSGWLMCIPDETTKEKGRRTRHKVGCGARVQVRGVGRRARVQAPAQVRAAEKRGIRGGVHTSRPNYILVLSSRPGSYF